MTEKDNRLLVAVTGGIASGKTTVTGMLLDLGVPLIDFDRLAREVVEPGEPAWRDIVAYFGEGVLREDGTLDRKMLSEIVFRDPEKREKLESFTHPRIDQAFEAQLEEITKDHPNAVIQVVVPLLIESNLQHRFHKILVVYVPREVQIERLVKRDNITEDEAGRILKAQLPIDEKVGYADFVIYNDKSLKETRVQVERLYDRFKSLQKED